MSLDVLLCLCLIDFASTYSYHNQYNVLLHSYNLIYVVIMEDRLNIYSIYRVVMNTVALWKLGIMRPEGCSNFYAFQFMRNEIKKLNYRIMFLYVSCQNTLKQKKSLYFMNALQEHQVVKRSYVFILFNSCVW